MQLPRVTVERAEVVGQGQYSQVIAGRVAGQDGEPEIRAFKYHAFAGNPKADHQPALLQHALDVQARLQRIPELAGQVIGEYRPVLANILAGHDRAIQPGEHACVEMPYLPFQLGSEAERTRMLESGIQRERNLVTVGAGLRLDQIFGRRHFIYGIYGGKDPAGFAKITPSQFERLGEQLINAARAGGQAGWIMPGDSYFLTLDAAGQREPQLTIGDFDSIRKSVPSLAEWHPEIPAETKFQQWAEVFSDLSRRRPTPEQKIRANTRAALEILGQIQLNHGQSADFAKTPAAEILEIRKGFNSKYESELEKNRRGHSRRQIAYFLEAGMPIEVARQLAFRQR